LLKIGDDGNGGAVYKGQTPSGTSLQSCVKSLVAPEVKVAEGATARNIVIAGLVVPVIYNLAISVAHGSTDHRVPHLRRNQRLQCLTEPSEVRMGVRNTKDRAMDRNNRAFRERNNLNGKIPQAMKLLNLLVITKALSERIVHNPGILCDHLFFGLVEEVLVEVVNEPGLAECLETEVHNPIPSVNSGRTGSKIRHTLGHTWVEHFGVYALIEIFE
jgi:hypothetical protein